MFTFLMEYENYSFLEALKYLADRAGVELPRQELSKEARERADTKAILLEINKAAARYFYIQLKERQGERALAYLKGRQLGTTPSGRSALAMPTNTATTSTAT